MLPTASHTISTLTENVPISDEEAGVWTKLMKHAIEVKIKATKSMLTVLTLRRLFKKGVGTDCVEKFVGRECSKEGLKERVKLVKKIMMMKIKDAVCIEEGTRRKVKKAMDYLERRWGQNILVMARMKEVMQEEVRRTWKEGREKLMKKVNFLERKWRRVRLLLGHF